MLSEMRENHKWKKKVKAQIINNLHSFLVIYCFDLMK